MTNLLPLHFPAKIRHRKQIQNVGGAIKQFLTSQNEFVQLTVLFDHLQTEQQGN